MNLYHTITTYHLLNAIVHKQVSGEPGTLLLSKWIIEKFPHYEKLEQFFDRVIIFEANYGFTNTPEKTEEYILSTIGSFEEYNEVYIWGAQYSLGIYMTEKALPFVFCEEGSGLLSRPDILRDICRKLHAKIFDHVNELGLYSGEAAYIKRYLCNTKAQVDGFEFPEAIEHFDLVAEMGKLPEDTRNAVIDFFMNRCTLTADSDSVLLLTQNFANLLVLTYDEQVLIYQMVMDYFFTGKKLVIKPHPDDVTYYSKLFENVRIIREKFPSEFMPFIFENQPNCVATISSTAIFNLRGHYPQVFELDTRYEKNFYMTHRYYAAVSMAKQLGLDIACVGANELLVKRLCETMGSNAPSVLEGETHDKPCLYIVDDVTAEEEEGRESIQNRLLSLDEHSCVVFINSAADYCWYSYERKSLWDHIKPVVLKKQAIREMDEDFCTTLDTEILYAYSKNKELLNMVEKMEIKKDLPHVGVRVEKEAMTPEQEKIKMLEGILAATEKRLLYYINKENEEG